jgi:hypothetical protein
MVQPDTHFGESAKELQVQADKIDIRNGRKREANPGQIMTSMGNTNAIAGSEKESRENNLQQLQENLAQLPERQRRNSLQFLEEQFTAETGKLPEQLMQMKLDLGALDHVSKNNYQLGLNRSEASISPRRTIATMSSLSGGAAVEEEDTNERTGWRSKTMDPAMRARRNSRSSGADAIKAAKLARQRAQGVEMGGTRGSLDWGGSRLEPSESPRGSRRKSRGFTKVSVLPVSPKRLSLSPRSNNKAAKMAKNAMAIAAAAAGVAKKVAAQALSKALLAIKNQERLFTSYGIEQKYPSLQVLAAMTPRQNTILLHTWTNSDLWCRQYKPQFWGRELLRRELVKSIDEFESKVHSSRVRIWTAWLRYRCRIVCDTRMFDRFFVMAIIVNTVILAAAHHGQSDRFMQSCDTINLFLTMVFTLELVFKFLGYLRAEFWSDHFNQFDFLIVVLSLAEVSFPVFTGINMQQVEGGASRRLVSDMDLASGNGESGSTVSAFRIFRVLRMFRVLRVLKMVKYLDSLRQIIAVIIETLPSLMWVMTLTVLLLFIFAVLGMQLFGTVDAFDKRSNFSSFGRAALTMFEMLTAVNWNTLMYDYCRRTTPFSSFFFVIWIVIGDFVMLSLVLVVILESFTSNSTDEDKHTVEANMKVKALGEKFLRYLRQLFDKIDMDGGGTLDVIELQQALILAGHDDMDNAEIIEIFKSVDEDDSGEIDFHEFCLLYQDLQSRGGGKGKKKKALMGKGIAALFLNHGPPPNKPFGFFSSDMYIRQISWYLTNHPLWDRAVLLLIFMNSVTMAMEHPFVKEEDPEMFSILYAADLVLTTLFALELLLNTISHGVLVFLRDPWNKMDALIVLTSLISVAAHDVQLSLFKAMRLLRALRPLRVIRRAPELKVAVNALFQSISAISNVAALIMILWLVFGILGMNLWSGKFHHCNDPRFPGWNTTYEETGFIGHKSGCNGTFVNKLGITTARHWVNKPFGYDNIFRALLTLFEVSSLDAWTDISHASADAYQIDHQPRSEIGPSGYVFYAFFVVLSSFFFMQLFVGVVYDNFNRLKSEQDGSILLSDAQKKWIKHQKLAFRAVSGYEVDTDKYGPLRMRCFRITQSPKFEYFIMVCILGNALTMATSHYDEPGSVTKFVVVSDYIFTFIFIAEAIIKLLGLGFTIYFMESWNRFDFTIVFFSLVDKGIEWSGSMFFAEVPIGRTILRMLRVARVARMVRLVKKAKSLRALFNTFMLSIPSMMNVSALLLLSLYIFAVLAMDLFGTVKVTSIIRSIHFRSVLSPPHESPLLSLALSRPLSPSLAPARQIRQRPCELQQLLCIYHHPLSSGHRRQLERSHV